MDTLSVRLFKSSLICSAAPQFAAEALLRAEGFKEIAYVEVPRTEVSQAFSDGRVDFTVTFAVNHIQAIDRGAPITILPAYMRAATSCSPAKVSTASPN
jgi:ABC-type nitrate/sulfonate/bicarbonate transport system substrate-binding protein